MTALRRVLAPAPEWQEQAICSQTDPDSFYPELGASSEPAKAICYRCDVRTECLEYALDNNEIHGIWGGTTERERRKLKSERATRGGPVTPIRIRQRAGIADHHHTIVEMLAREPQPATWAEIADAIGYSLDAVKAYWQRQKQAVAA